MHAHPDNVGVCGSSICQVHVGRLGEEDSQELDRGEERQKYRKGERRCEVKGQERETKDRQERPAAVRPRLTALFI